MKPVIAVGLDSTLDIWVTFPSLTDFRKFIRQYHSSLGEYMEEAYTALRESTGGELPIDGKAGDVQKFLDVAQLQGARIKYALGGNAGQEAATLKALGANVVFAGYYFPSQLSKLAQEERDYFTGADLSFACSSNMKPVSVIIQARGTNRFILCDGEGRRIAQLRTYLQKLPSILEQVSDDYGRLDMVNLVGWQVLFGNGINNKDVSMVKRTIGKIRKVVNSPLFADAGSFAAFDKNERRLLSRIYSMFDILSVNGDEVLHVSQAMGAETKDEFQAMCNILESSECISTVWVHSLYHQASLSTKYSRKLLENAQLTAATAGVCRVEKGAYPTLEEIAKRRKTKNYSKKGLKTAAHASKKYGGKIGDAELVVTPCYKARGFESTVGAGDVASAAYTYVLAGGEIF
jgi:hypothetical protein